MVEIRKLISLNNHAAILRSKNVMGTGVIPLKRAPAIASGAGVGYRSRQPGRDAPRRGPREAAAAERLTVDRCGGPVDAGQRNLAACGKFKPPTR